MCVLCVCVVCVCVCVRGGVCVCGLWACVCSVHVCVQCVSVCAVHVCVCVVLCAYVSTVYDNCPRGCTQCTLSAAQ